jgi:hypothetical protein
LTSLKQATTSGEKYDDDPGCIAVESAFRRPTGGHLWAAAQRPDELRPSLKTLQDAAAALHAIIRA